MNIPIPDPLHPAVVHFPIVLILLGTGLVCASVVIRRWHLPMIAATTLLLGALGAMAAYITGEQEEEMVGEIGPRAEQLLDEHEQLGETARNLSIVAAALAFAAAILPAIWQRRPARQEIVLHPAGSIAAALGTAPWWARLLSALAAMAALSACLAVAQAGHHGGQLVYKHGVGVNLAAGAAQEANTATQATLHKEKKKKHKDDDDD